MTRGFRGSRFFQQGHRTGNQRKATSRAYNEELREMCNERVLVSPRVSVNFGGSISSYMALWKQGYW